MLNIPFIIGHRGGAGLENTLESISAAIAAGVKAIEVDIQLTRDGQLVVFHDEDLSRLADNSGKIAEISLADLKRYPLSDGESWHKYAIPTLHEVISLTAKHNVLLNIEMKSYVTGSEAIETLTDQMLSCIRAFPEYHALIISSFDFTMLEEVRARDKNIAIACLAEGYSPDVLAAAQQLRAEAINLSNNHITAADVQDIHSHGYSCAVYTVNDIERAKALKSMGVNAIFTDAVLAFLDTFAT